MQQQLAPGKRAPSQDSKIQVPGQHVEAGHDPLSVCSPPPVENIGGKSGKPEGVDPSGGAVARCMTVNKEAVRDSITGETGFQMAGNVWKRIEGRFEAGRKRVC